MNCRILGLAALALTALSVSANAQLVYMDTTAGNPTWNRPVAGNPPVAPLSAVGTNVPYDITEFYVNVTGSYNFLSVATNPAAWDNYTFLYHTSFSPVSQFTNVIIGNDDFPSIGNSGFNGINLTAGTQYFLVTTGFSNSDAGAYTNTITGPSTAIIGQVGAAVPEPGSVALLIGMASMSGIMIRRRKK